MTTNVLTKTERVGLAAHLHIGNSLDFMNRTPFKEATTRLLDQGVRHIVLNFADTERLDSTGLGALFSLYKRLNEVEGTLVLEAISRPVQVVLQLTDAFRIFEVNTHGWAHAQAASRRPRDRGAISNSRRPVMKPYPFHAT